MRALPVAIPVNKAKPVIIITGFPPSRQEKYPDLILPNAGIG
jgi:hypothetical protein